MTNSYSRRVERLEAATSKVCGRSCVKCLLASLPIVQDRGACVTAAERACDGNPMSLTEILMEISQ